MAFIATTRSHAGGHSFGGRLAAIMTGIHAWNDARMTRKALSGLTDRELDDIGLVRGDIDTIARG